MTDVARITLAHGNGGVQMQELLQREIWPRLANTYLAEQGDAAVLPGIPNAELVLTTDGFVVQPLFFPGGDIGHLAVCGTINDVAMMGAEPVALALALILEAGLELEVVRRVMASIQATAAAAGVPVVTGDTKVVEAGKADGLYVTTSGVGWRRQALPTGWRTVRPGDAILVSGSIGHHGVAVMAARAQLPFSTPLRSDVAPLHTLVRALLAAVGAQVRWLRDPTRGGVAAALNELATQAGCEIELIADAIPVADDIRGAAEILGLDPLYLANEGRCLIVCAADAAETALACLHAHPLGTGAARIGTISAARAGGRVVLATGFGGRRIVDMPSGEQVPRIC
jgi:hydrogenase expression/formation protein HypE